MKLLVMFMMFKLILQVKANGFVVKLKLMNNQVREYPISSLAIRESTFINNCKRYDGSVSKMTGKCNDHLEISIACRPETFGILDKLLNDKFVANWNELANEFTLNILNDFWWTVNFLKYDFNVKGIINEKVFRNVLPRTAFSIKDESTWPKMYRNDIHTDGAYQFVSILFEYMIWCGLGISKENDVATIYKDPAGKFIFGILNDFTFSKVKILPEVLNINIKDNNKTTDKERLKVVLWLIDVLFSITEVEMNGCVISERHIELLSLMNNVETVKLRECIFESDKEYNGKILELNTVKNLDISGMKLDEEISEILCKFIDLRRLTMEKCLLNSKNNYEFIRKQNNLEELRIGGNTLSGKQVDMIFRHESIKILDMEKCIIEEMYMFGGKIESLDILKAFNDCRISVKGCEIRIQHSQVISGIEAHLEKLKAYNGCLLFFEEDDEIEITRRITTKMFDNVIDKIGDFRKERVKLKEFNNSRVFFDKRIMKIVFLNDTIIPKGFNKIKFNRARISFLGDKKVNFFNESDCRNFMKNVKEFNAGQVYFNDRVMEMILSHMGLKKLSLRQCGLESNMIMKIKSNNMLEEFDLSNNNMIGEDDLAHIIKECPNLTKLNINGCRMLIKGDFNDIPILKRLKELNVGENKLNHECIDYISNHKQLIKLNIEGCKLMDSCIAKIGDLRMLKELYVGDNFLNSECLNKIFKISGLSVLSMPRCELFLKDKKENVSIIGFRKLYKLNALDMSGNSLSYVNIEEIFNLSTLKELSLENCSLDTGMLANVKKLVNLRTLRIGGNEICKKDMDAITRLIRLRELSIPNCKIYDERPFMNFRRLSESLIVLDVGGSYLSDRDVKMLGCLINLQELKIVDYATFSVLFNTIKEMKSLRILYLGIIDAKEFSACDDKDLMSLSRLEILNIKYGATKNEFIKNFTKLKNLRELTLDCVEVCGKNLQETLSLDISLFPRQLKKLEIMGESPLDLFCNSEIFLENLEELRLFNVKNISEESSMKIASIPKLRKLKIHMNSTSFLNFQFKELETITMLEELELNGINLKEKMRFSDMKCLRKLTINNCDLNDNHIREIEELKYLEVLNISRNGVAFLLNGILALKNLRELSASTIRFNYDEEGSFGLIRGFERLEYVKWETYRNGEHVVLGEKEFDDVVLKMKNEGTMNNWKGLVKFGIWGVDINSPLFCAVSSRLVFIKSISLETKLIPELAEGEVKMLENCLMLREIKWRLHIGYMCPTQSIAIGVINNKPLLQSIDILVDRFTSDITKTLLEYKYLHTINLYVKGRIDGGLTELLRKDIFENTLLRSVNIQADDNGKVSHIPCMCSEDAVNFDEEKVRRYICKEDMDAIIKIEKEYTCECKIFYWYAGNSVETKMLMVSINRK